MMLDHYNKKINKMMVYFDVFFLLEKFVEICNS
jgi:hypothetical protein